MALMVVAGIGCFLSSVWACKDNGSPLSIFFLSWSAILCLLFLDCGVHLVGYQDILPSTWLATGLALSMMACGWLMVPKSPQLTIITYERVSGVLMPACLIVLCAIGYVLYMKQVVSLCSGKTLIGFFLKWNHEETMGELKEFGGISGRLATLPAIALPSNIYFIARGSKYRKTLIVFSLVEFAFLISPRRALILQTLVSTVFVYVYVNGLSRRMIRLLVSGAIGVILLFSVTQVALNKAGGDGLSSGLMSAYVYFSSNIPIFQQLTRSSGSTGGEYVLNIPLRITGKLGLNKAPDLSIPFVKVPVEGNTAPFFYYPYRDWGLAGVVVFSWLAGFLSAIVYHRRSHGMAWVLVSAFVATAMVFSVRENIFITYQFWYAIFVSFVIGKIISSPEEVLLHAEME